MPYPQTNLQVLRPSRKKPQAGDVFAMQLLDGSHLFGLLLDADIQDPHRSPMQGSYLIYVYKHRLPVKQAPIDELTPENLLLAPVFINRMPWSRGYFETIDHIDITTEHLATHASFWDTPWKRYLDQDGNTLGEPTPLQGTWGLASYRWLDDRISDALGIPRVPDDA